MPTAAPALAKFRAAGGAVAAPQVEYPVSDGLPMADSVAQNRAMRVVAGAPELRFRERDDVFVACDLLLYY